MVMYDAWTWLWLNHIIRMRVGACARRHTESFLHVMRFRQYLHSAAGTSRQPTIAAEMILCYEAS